MVQSIRATRKKPDMAKMSDAGIRHLKEFEGLRTAAYKDVGGIWTIGWGHTGPDVTEGLVITQEKAEQLLRRDLRKFEDGVERALSAPAHQDEFDAMVSFAYNVGLNAFRTSTLLKHFNAGNHELAMAEFARWTKVGDKEVEGLRRRRRAEAEIYKRGGRA